MFELKAVGFGVVLPGLVTAAVLLAGIRSAGVLPDNRRRRVVRLASALAIGVGFLVGFIVSGWALGFAPLSPQRTWHWLPYLAWAAIAFGLLESRCGGPWWLWIAMRVPVSLAVAAVLAPDYGRHAPDWWPLTIGLTAAVFAWWTICEPLAKDRFAVVWPAVILMASFAAALVAFSAGSNGLMHAAGVLFAVMAATLSLSSLRRCFFW